MFVTKIERSKCNPMARKSIVGHSQDSKGYRIYNHVKMKTVTARTVKFDEKIKGSRLLRENDKIPEFGEILLGRDEQTNSMEKETWERIEFPIEESDETPQERETSQQKERRNERQRRVGMIEAEKQAELFQKNMEQEQQLQQQGVRRSKRIKGKIQKMSLGHRNYSISANYTKALEGDNRGGIKQCRERANKHAEPQCLGIDTKNRWYEDGEK